MNDTDSRFLCIGLIMNDILMTGIHTLPENWEQAVAAKGIRQDTGGGAANSARTLGRLGCLVGIAGRIGCDAFGDSVEKSLIGDKVDVKGLVKDPDGTTGVAVGLVNENGQRCFVTLRGSNAAFQKHDLKRIENQKYDYVHVNGYFQFPGMEPDMKEILMGFREKGSVISFDMASSDPAGRWFETIEPFVGMIDFLFANETQIKKISGKETIEEASSFLLRKGVKNVIAKLGKDGSMAFQSGKTPVRVTGIPVEAVDTTGAGDSFDGAYMLGVSKGWDAVACGRFANVVAGFNCREFGGTAGVPDYETAEAAVEQYYKKRKGR